MAQCERKMAKWIASHKVEQESAGDTRRREHKRPDRSVVDACMSACVMCNV